MATKRNWHPRARLGAFTTVTSKTSSRRRPASLVRSADQDGDNGKQARSRQGKNLHSQKASYTNGS